jgi:hypothetical protein
MKKLHRRKVFYTLPSVHNRQVRRLIDTAFHLSPSVENLFIVQVTGNTLRGTAWLGLLSNDSFCHYAIFNILSFYPPCIACLRPDEGLLAKTRCILRLRFDEMIQNKRLH